mmetsp:Transcript_34625/g.111241  ORF Transcript_34625/g.111241 Transcript_34625/m.111241 type:complete len:210 (-) Transcript_34625:177-806(-)
MRQREEAVRADGCDARQRKVGADARAAAAHLELPPAAAQHVVQRRAQPVKHDAKVASLGKGAVEAADGDGAVGRQPRLHLAQDVGLHLRLVAVLAHRAHNLDRTERAAATLAHLDDAAKRPLAELAHDLELAAVEAVAHPHHVVVLRPLLRRGRVVASRGAAGRAGPLARRPALGAILRLAPRRRAPFATVAAVVPVPRHVELKAAGRV